MEDRKEQFEKDLQELKVDVKEILYLLTGTEYDSTQGLLHQFANEKIKSVTIIEKLEMRVVKLEKMKDKIVYAGLGLALPAGYSIADIIHTFFGHK